MQKSMIVVLLFLAIASSAYSVTTQVVVEEDVYKFTNPNNGSGPLWAYGSTEIVRIGGDVYVCQMEAGEGIPPLSNTRWRLSKRTAEGWKVIAEPERFIQREPCPLALIGKNIFMSVNDSTQPEGTKYGNCEPHVLKFFFENDKYSQSKLVPVWKKQHTFTDHSYRGFSADPESGNLLMLNIDAKTSEENACLMNAAGETLGGASISYPIRACYPQVALRGKSVHVLAIGDIVEPVDEWKKYKFEQTKATWDYVFRILYYTSTPDVTASEFATPIEIANVDKTAGAISNQDLWLSPEGDAYILYTEREVSSALLRDKFFPGKSLIGSLHLAIVKDGVIKSRHVLYPGTVTSQPGHARFHVAADGTLYAVLYATGTEGGNKLMQIYPSIENPPLIPITAKKPLSSFCLSGVRAGNLPSNIIDMLGQIGVDTMSYMQVEIQPGK